MRPYFADSTPKMHTSPCSNLLTGRWSWLIHSHCKRYSLRDTRSICELMRTINTFTHSNFLRRLEKETFQLLLLELKTTLWTRIASTTMSSDSISMETQG